jgi:hypothetical protein
MGAEEHRWIVGMLECAAGPLQATPLSKVQTANLWKFDSRNSRCGVAQRRTALIQSRVLVRGQTVDLAMRACVNVPAAGAFRPTQEVAQRAHVAALGAPATLGGVQGHLRSRAGVTHHNHLIVFVFDR